MTDLWFYLELTALVVAVPVAVITAGLLLYTASLVIRRRL